jgi:hypothetical protein
MPSSVLPSLTSLSPDQFPPRETARRPADGVCKRPRCRGGGGGVPKSKGDRPWRLRDTNLDIGLHQNPRDSQHRLPRIASKSPPLPKLLLPAIAINTLVSNRQAKQQTRECLPTSTLLRPQANLKMPSPVLFDPFFCQFAHLLETNPPEQSSRTSSRTSSQEQPRHKHSRARVGGGGGEAPRHSTAQQPHGRGACL